MTRSKPVDAIAVVLALTLGSAALSSPEVNGFSSPSVLRVVIDQQDSNVLYAATYLYTQAPEHGVFKSTDQGQSWFTVNDGLPDLNVSTMAMDPQNSDTLYVGVNDGIFKSINGGGLWSPTAPPGVYNIHDIAVDPLDSNTIFAGGDGAFSYTKSTDGAITWSPSPGIGHVFSFAIDPRNSETIYAGVFRGKAGGAVYKSIDGGDHWFSANRGLPEAWVSAVVIDHQNSKILYAGTAEYGLYKSTDGAAQWNLSLEGIHLSAHCLAMDPRDSNTVYAGTSEDAPGYPKRIFKTTDGGDTWYEADSGITTQTWTYSLAIDRQDSTIIYAGTNHGIFKSIDAGDSWFPTGLQ